MSSKETRQNIDSCCEVEPGRDSNPTEQSVELSDEDLSQVTGGGRVPILRWNEPLV